MPPLWCSSYKVTQVSPQKDFSGMCEKPRQARQGLSCKELNGLQSLLLLGQPGVRARKVLQKAAAWSNSQRLHSDLPRLRTLSGEKQFGRLNHRFFTEVLDKFLI